jgi:hypothetical protein
MFQAAWKELQSKLDINFPTTKKRNKLMTEKAKQ